MSHSQSTATFHVDAYTPGEMARLVEAVGVRKAQQRFLQTAVLGVLAGAFIALGAMLFLLVMTGQGLAFGPHRLLGGVAFSLGLILVVVGGAELFTGNSLIVMAWAEKKVTSAQIARNWTLVYIANFIGSLGLLVMAYWAGFLDLPGLAATAARAAEAKVALTPVSAFFKGVLCNLLVCLAVWLCFAAKNVEGKILAIVFPISAFVALGFEHSVANMFLIPLGWVAGGNITLGGFLGNLIPVTLGNIVGGGVLVAATYWAVYLRAPD